MLCSGPMLTTSASASCCSYNGAPPSITGAGPGRVCGRGPPSPPGEPLAAGGCKLTQAAKAKQQTDRGAGLPAAQRDTGSC